ncbi:MAG: 50S ribosomal protein L7/L12 [Verrucomicrobiae bacterium]|nr:50S ribosomal protein L7/L12 [Verrucomicrobiae bacterium]
MAETLNRGQVVEWLSSQSVIEIAGLVKELEEKWGVKAAAPAAAAAAAPAAGAAAAPASDAKVLVSVILKSAPADKKIAVIKEVRVAVPGLGLGDAKKLVEEAPKAVKENIERAEAEEIKKKLEAAGGVVEIK